MQTLDYSFIKNKMKIKTKELDLPFVKIATWAILGLFVAIVPAFVHSQWLTGPFVNAILLLTSVLVGPMEAVILGLIPSTVALSSGILPLPLAPMIPFIMISNALFIAVFHSLSQKSFALAVLVAAFLKYLFLFFFVTFLASSLFSDTLIGKVAILMSWPQFATALLGGLVAFLLLKLIQKS